MSKLSILDPYYIEKKSIYVGITKYLKYFSGICLDVACGFQPYRDLIKPKVNKYIALDLDKNVFLGDSEMNTVADFTRLPFKTGSIDTILSTQMLEHTSKPDNVLREMHRILRDKGILILSIPQTWPVHCMPFDYYRFTKFGIEFLLSETDFKILEISSRGGFWIMISQMLNMYIHDSTSGLNSDKLLINSINRIINGMKKILMVSISLLGPRLDIFDKRRLNSLGYIVVAKKHI